ncbi:hypothetical protein AN964_22785 [Heyndrickxia shackletonii]|uniref:Uncharacterized protein n=1 Tax=Heyndrickxia shackletonii TaxID=157838 RepID=A0A0Q3T906_9BACI|nr:hypothetical protein [Heyndrickxia shackletonii]KQL50486.1 hypothetical protein AN964_22785 [Heyndrickxia shackletonii]NEZ01518.1 hypothetical protein [Heyndrickxia shackletonii]
MGIGLGTFIIVIIIFISIMTWYYPLSPFSVNHSFTYHPGWETHNGKTYKEELNEFKGTYEKDLKESSASDNINFTVERTRYILPIFEQNWLIGTDPKSMDKDKLSRMLFDVEQARNTLLDLVSEGDYNKEEKEYLVDTIKSFLSLEESIRQIKDGKYFSRSDLETLFGNLRGAFRSEFNLYTTNFYDRSNK